MLFRSFRPQRMSSIPLPEELAAAEVLMEEVWVHEQYLAGAKLAACRTLGIVSRQPTDSDPYDVMEARMAILERFQFDAFDVVTEENMMASVHVSDLAHGVSVLDGFSRGV